LKRKKEKRRSERGEEENEEEQTRLNLQVVFSLFDRIRKRSKASLGTPRPFLSPRILSPDLSRS